MVLPRATSIRVPGDRWERAFVLSRPRRRLASLGGDGLSFRRFAQTGRLALQDETTTADAPTPRMFSWARNSTIYRIERRVHTEKQLRDAIARKAREKFEDISDAQVRALAESAVKFAYDNKALDDAAYAEASSRSGMRSGRSRRAVALKLAQKGVAKETASAAVAGIDDLFAALVLARKRAFGPFRKAAPDEKRRDRELAAFARAGFGFDIARTVLAMPLEDAEEALAAGRHL